MDYLLDTNVCIAFLELHDRKIETRLLSVDPDRVALCSVVKAELYFGAHKSARVEQNLARFNEFFALFQSLPFDDAAAEWYGRIRADLAREGQPIGANDLLIAAIALAANATLVTRNEREFRRVPHLHVERW